MNSTAPFINLMDYINLIYPILIMLYQNAHNVAGLALPPFIDYVNKQVANEKARFIITILMCLGLATVFKWESLAYGSPDEVLQAATLIFIESQAVFKLYFKTSYLRKTIQDKYTNTEALNNNPVDIRPN